MILVILKEEQKSTTSVWLSEINDLKFTKISTMMLGVDWDREDASNSIKIEYHINMIEKLPGLVFISQVTRRDGKTRKLTTVSYNYGNTFIPLKYKSQKGHCEWVSELIRDGLPEISALMISHDGGYSWADVPLTNYSIENNKPSFSLDRGNTWTELTFNPSNYHMKYFVVGQGPTKFKFLALTFSSKQTGYEIVIGEKCYSSDYKTITPGRELLNSCFHGRDGFIYTKTSSKICESVISDLPKIKSKPCVCTPADYRW
ncbi:hypothetical protein RF11_03793 [Thelohanellus kitauei]|uniref:Vacuolar protein sorting/targeting protein 10 n=1 Tax=Thelohanellus kitauei TaxID=669202 RepID=A0A0C2JHU8_THEKT|nr:hypothetical protein RF11_03793 [Thelohanellus kitauei]